MVKESYMHSRCYMHYSKKRVTVLCINPLTVFNDNRWRVISFDMSTKTAMLTYVRSWRNNLPAIPVFISKAAMSRRVRETKASTFT